MDMTIPRCLKGLCIAAALAGAMAALQVPAEARRADASQLAAGTKVDTAVHKTAQRMKSVPPRKRSRCHG